MKIDECGGMPSGTTLDSLTTAFEQYGADLRAADPGIVYSEELPIFTLGQSDFTVGWSVVNPDDGQAGQDQQPGRIVVHARGSSVVIVLPRQQT